MSVLIATITPSNFRAIMRNRLADDLIAIVDLGGVAAANVFLQSHRLGTIRPSIEGPKNGDVL